MLPDFDTLHAEFVRVDARMKNIHDEMAPYSAAIQAGASCACASKSGFIEWWASTRDFLPNETVFAPPSEGFGQGGALHHLHCLNTASALAARSGDGVIRDLVCVGIVRQTAVTRPRAAANLGVSTL